MAIGLFLALPLLSIVVYLLYGVGEMWGHIVEHFLLDYVSNSLILLVGTGTLTLLFGVTSAWIVANYDFRFRGIIEWLLFLPLAIPSYIVAYAYVGALGNGGTLIGILQSCGISIQKVEMMNIYGLIWVLSCSLFPYVYASCRVFFKSISKSAWESAHLLGASRRRYFFSVALPLSIPAVIAGVLLVFMEVLNDYGAAKYFGINTFTTGIFRTWTALEDLQSAIYLSALLVGLVLVINWLIYFQRGKRSYSFRNGGKETAVRERLKGYKRFLYPSAVLVPFVFGFLLPVSQLSYWGYLTFESMFSIELLWIAVQSFGVASISAFFVVLVALGLVYFSRWNHISAVQSFKKFATIGYAIPGAIIGIGVIRNSQSIIDFFANNFSIEIGFLFYGSSAVLIYAYLFRFMAVGFNPIESNSLKIGKKLSESAYLLGSGKFRALFRIELPLLRNTIISAFLLVFIDILKELPLTLILKPYNLNTLAMKAYEYAEDEQVPEAALPSLLLIASIALLMVLLNLGERKLKTED